MIHITTAANENYAPGLLVTVASMLISIDPDVELTLHFLNGGVSSSTVEKLKRMCESLHAHCTLVDIPMDESLFAGANLGPGNSYMAYARLLMGSLIREPKVIYVDSDMVIQKDLSELWNLNMQGARALVCADPIIKRLAEDCPIKLTESDIRAPYFNTGLIVIDLDYWREKGFETTAIHIAKNYKCALWDQTILNYLLKNSVIFLNQIWNWPFADVCIQGEIQKWNYHFSDKQKPWLYYGSSLKHKVWRYYYKYYIGKTLNLYLSFKGTKALIQGFKEILIRRSLIFRSMYFRYLKKRINSDAGINSIMKFYCNDALKITTRDEKISLKRFTLYNKIILQ